MPGLQKMICIHAGRRATADATLQSAPISNFSSVPDPVPDPVPDLQILGPSPLSHLPHVISWPSLEYNIVPCAHLFSRAAGAGRGRRGASAATGVPCERLARRRLQKAVGHSLGMAHEQAGAIFKTSKAGQLGGLSAGTHPPRKKKGRRCSPRLTSRRNTWINLPTGTCSGA